LVLGTKADMWRVDCIGEGTFRHLVCRSTPRKCPHTERTCPRMTVLHGWHSPVKLLLIIPSKWLGLKQEVSPWRQVYIYIILRFTHCIHLAGLYPLLYDTSGPQKVAVQGAETSGPCKTYDGRMGTWWVRNRRKSTVWLSVLDSIFAREQFRVVYFIGTWILPHGHSNIYCIELPIGIYVICFAEEDKIRMFRASSTLNTGTYLLLNSPAATVLYALMLIGMNAGKW